MFKEGDKVRVNPNAPTPNSFYWNPKRMHKTPGQIGVIVEIDEEVGAIKVEFIDRACYWYAPSDLEKITEENIGVPKLTDGGSCKPWEYYKRLENEKIKQEETIMKPELKFEIGKKYKLLDFCNNPYIYLDDAHKHGFEVECRHVFRDRDGDIIEIDEADIDSAEEYREPYKKTIEGWIGYDDGERESTISGLLLNKRSSTYIHSKKEGVGELWKNQEFVRITLEVIPHD